MHVIRPRPAVRLLTVTLGMCHSHQQFRVRLLAGPFKRCRCIDWQASSAALNDDNSHDSRSKTLNLVADGGILARTARTDPKRHSALRGHVNYDSSPLWPQLLVSLCRRPVRCPASKTRSGWIPDQNTIELLRVPNHEVAGLTFLCI